MIATKLILDQGIEVHGIHCVHPFAGDHDFYYKKGCKKEDSARTIAKQLGIQLEIVDVTDKMLFLLKKPKYGFGKHLNPCLDCKLMMMETALVYLSKLGADFMISGEVVGQRGMSQRVDTMPIGSQLTKDLILRPLSAKLLPPTYPERMGWINRNALLDWSGRSRKPQLSTVSKWGLNYSTPGGGCLLTDINFCNRLKDLFEHKIENYTVEDLWLLRVGRHYRLNEGKVIVGRDQVENDYLRLHNLDKKSAQASVPGALVLGDLSVSDEMLAKIAAYFSKARYRQVEVEVKERSNTKIFIACGKEEPGVRL